MTQPVITQRPEGHPGACGCDACHEYRGFHPTAPTSAPAPPAYPYPYAPQPRTNGLAIASMVLGITWIWWIGSLLAIIFGIVALRQIGQSNGAQTGRGMATAGLVLGWVGCSVFALFIIMWVVAAATSTQTSY